MMLKIQTTITILLFLVITCSCILAKAEPTKPEEVPGMIFIKGGTFQMGEKVKSTVTVEDFYMGKYEVTNKEYCQYDRNHKNPGDNLPVVMVSWDDAVSYCKWLSSKTGKNYRLPTEAEWEYACRAGSTTDYYWGENMDPNTRTCTSIDAYCWYDKNSNNQIHPVGQKKPNAWGLYDMAGNVWEWCSDWYDSSNQYRARRSGAWNSIAHACQSGYRGSITPDYHQNNVGFRVVMKP